MALFASDKGGGSFDPVPQKIHHAVCIGVIDLGTHLNTIFNKSVHQVLITWELPYEKIVIEKEGQSPEEKSRWISNKYTLSLHEKANLRKMLESWRGKSFTSAELEGFDLKKLLTVNGQLQVIHNKKDDKVYANVNNLMPLMPEMTNLEAENPYVYFSLEESFDIPEGVPDWVMDIIKQSDEWRSQLNGEPDSTSGEQPPFDEGDIPF